MKFRTTLILVAVMVGLFLYMYRFEIVREREEQAAEELAGRVMPYDPDSVTTLAVRTDGERVVCRKTDSGWEITEPIRTGGDDEAIEMLIGNITETSIERDLVEDAHDLSQFGLDAPTAAVALGGEGFSSDTLELGKKNPTQTYAYARKSGSNEVFLLPQVTISQVEKDLFDLRDKSILEVDREEIRKFTIEREDVTVTCEKRDEEWYLTQPVEDRAERGSVSRVLSSVANGKASGFAAEAAGDLRKYGLADPRATVHVYTGADMTRHTILIGEEEERKVYAKVAARDPVLQLTLMFYEAITQDPHDFRFKKLLDVERSEITGIEISEGEETVVCEQDTAGNWFVVKSPGPEREPAKESKINQLLSTLVTLRVEEFVEDSPGDLSTYGLHEPVLRVKVLGREGEIGTVSFGSDSEDEVYAMSSHRDLVVLVRGRSVDNIRVDYAELRAEEKDEGEGGPAE